MRAIAYSIAGPIEARDSLFDVEMAEPVLGNRDLLVEVKAISVNPVDTKVRRKVSAPDGEWKILGWDAAGTVVGTGRSVQNFKIGDKVYYAGDLTRQGTNAQRHAVDERIVGHMPKSLDFAPAAALPLTAITAWEALLDRLDVNRPEPGSDKSILIIGGAGGVSSIAIQLARQLTTLKVIATASNDISRDWCELMGAHVVVDHSVPLAEEIRKHQLAAPEFVFSTTQTEMHLPAIAELIAPQGRFAVIDDPAVLDINPFKRKSVSVHWEFMFTRSMHQTADIAEQGKLLNKVASLVDEGKIKPTLGNHFGRINAANLKRAHAHIESGRAKGKIVLEGFGT
jgi:NADPH:quinone reductase